MKIVYVGKKLYSYNYVKDNHRGKRIKKKEKIENYLKWLKTTKGKLYRVDNNVVYLIKDECIIIDNDIYNVCNIDDLEMFDKEEIIRQRIPLVKIFSLFNNVELNRKIVMFLLGAIVFGNLVTGMIKSDWFEESFGCKNDEDFTTSSIEEVIDESYGQDNQPTYGNDLVESAPIIDSNTDSFVETNIVSTSGGSSIIPELQDVFSSAANSDIGTYIEKYSEMFGIDKNILYAMAFKESSFDHYACLPGGAEFNNYGMGLMQVENLHEGSVVSAIDVNGNEVSVTIDEGTLYDMEKNVEVASIILKGYIDRYQGNVALAIHAYNSGPGPVGFVCSVYADKLYGEVTNDTVREIYRSSINDPELLTNILDDLVTLGWDPSEYIMNAPQSARDGNPNYTADYGTKNSRHANPEYYSNVTSCLNGRYVTIGGELIYLVEHEPPAKNLSY